MRIGIDARFYGSVGKGLGRYTEKLIAHLERLDTENEYVVFLRRENFDEYRPGNPRFRKRLAHYQWYGFAEQFGFCRMLYRERLDLMHFPHFNVPLLYLRPFAVTIHDLILVHYPTIRNSTRPSWFYRMKFLAYRFVIASAIRRARSIITVSRFTENDLLRHYPFSRGKITVTYEATDDKCAVLGREEEERFLGRLGLLKNDIIRPYVLYVGNAYPHKNLERLTRWAKAFPELLFVLVGKEDYFYARLKRKVEADRIPNVLFAGFVPDRELGTLYRHGQAYVFPSLYEGFGLPPLEAMSYGLPVLSSDRGSLPEILGRAALFFDPEDQASFVQGLKTILGDRRLREELVRTGYGRLRYFSWDEMADRTLRIYREILRPLSKKTKN